MTTAQGITYPIDVVFHGRDEGAQGHADRLSGSLAGLEGRMGSITGAMERMGAMAVTAVGGLAVAGVGMLARGVAHLNATAESTTLTIAGMLQANGATSNLQDGMRDAAATLAQIRRDAAALPGEAQDFVQVFQTALPAALQSGMRSARDVAQFTNQFGAIATAFQVDAAQAGRDLRFMLQGHAGAQVAMWSHLQSLIGKSSEEFNRMTAPQRLAALQRATGRYGDMVNAYGNTWEAASSTIRSAGTELLRIGTQPLFERAKARAVEIANYLTVHGPEIERIVTRWGDRGAEAFDNLYTRAREGITWLRDHWRGLVADAMSGGRSMLTVYAGLQAMRGGLRAAEAIGGISTAARFLGLAGAAAPGAGAAAAAAGAALPVAGAAGAAAAVNLGALYVAQRNGAIDTQAALHSLRESAHPLKLAFEGLVHSAEPLVTAYGSLLFTSATKAAEALLPVATVFTTLVSVVAAANTALLNLGRSAMDAWRPAHVYTANGMSPEFAPTRDYHPGADSMHVVASARSRPGSDRRRDPAARTHNTTIHNHFRIEQADNPERVALSVMHVLQREMRSPTQAARPGVTTLRP